MGTQIDSYFLNVFSDIKDKMVSLDYFEVDFLLS